MHDSTRRVFVCPRCGWELGTTNAENTELRTIGAGSVERSPHTMHCLGCQRNGLPYAQTAVKWWPARKPERRLDEQMSGV